MNWKKILTVLGISALTVVVILFGGGMLLDSTVELETESTLDAPPEIIHALIADPAGVTRWWQDAAQEPGHEAMAEVTSRQGEGPATGPGATVLFEMDGKLLEEWTLISVKPPDEAVWNVDFQVFEVRRTLQLQALPDGKTRVRWHETGSFESPLSRWFTLMPTDAILENFQGAMRILGRKAQQELTARQEADREAAASAGGDDDSAGAE